MQMSDSRGSWGDAGRTKGEWNRLLIFVISFDSVQDCTSA